MYDDNKPSLRVSRATRAPLVDAHAKSRGNAMNLDRPTGIYTGDTWPPSATRRPGGLLLRRRWSAGVLCLVSTVTVIVFVVFTNTGQMQHALANDGTTSLPSQRVRREVSASPSANRPPFRDRRNSRSARAGDHVQGLRTVVVVPQRRGPTLYSTAGAYDADSIEYSMRAAKCPLDTSRMAPCMCRNLARGISVVCENLTQLGQMKGAFRELRAYAILDTTFINVPFEMQNQVFDDMRFIMLTFRKGNVTIRSSSSTNNYSLASLSETKETLREVHFMQCTVDLGNTTLVGRPLEYIELYESSFINYRENWFNGLTVSNVRIMSRKISEPIVRNMIGVVSLAHTNSGLRALGHEHLPHNREALVKLDFSKNELGYLPSDLLVGLPKLQQVILTGNQLTAIGKTVFQNVWLNMSLLNLEGNLNLNCASVKWMKEDPGKVKVKGVCINEDGLEQNIK